MSRLSKKKLNDHFESKFLIPIQPNILAELEKAKNDMDLFINVIMADPSISAQILIRINSPYYGLKAHISSIQRAVMLLGVDSIINLVRAFHLKNMTPKVEPLYLESFWQTSLLVALVCKRICPKLPFFLDSEELYALGLFHNCGIPIILSRYPDYKDIMVETYGQDINGICEVEDMQLGFDHSTLGYLLAHSWKLPEKICHCILEHHNLDVIMAQEEEGVNLESERIALSVLKMAEHFCSLFRFLGQQNVDIEWNVVKTNVCQNLDLSLHDYQELKKDLIVEFENFIDISIDD